MENELENLLILQAAMGAVLVIFGMLMLFFMQSLSIMIVYIAIALICFKDGLIQLLAAFKGITRKE